MEVGCDVCNVGKKAVIWFRYHVEALVVVARCRELVGAAGTSSVEAAGTSSVGMAKAKASNSGVTNVTTVGLL